LAEERAKRKLTAILSADVKGYSRLMGEDEKATVETLKTYREVMGNLIRHYKGRVIDSPGDNVLSEFASVVDAVECAVKIQEELKKKNEELPENRRMEFRIGVHHGDVIEDEKRIYGDGVNIAARIEGLAEGGGICISRTSFDSVKNKLNLGYEYLGQHTVKNIAEPVRVYKVLMEPEAAGKVIGEERPKPKQWRWAAIGGVVVLVIVAGALAIWNFYLRPDVEPASEEKMAFPLPDKPSLAVLPFDSLSGDPKQAYLADGLTENIIGGLSKIPEMFVIARNSSFTYKGKPVKVQQVAEDLGVRYVLEGSVQISADQLRVAAQLIDALKGYHVWSEKYDRKMENFFIIQDDITLNIAIALQGKLTEGEQAKIRHSTENLEAWSLAVEAHGLLETYTRENIAKARELFKKAVDLDPNYAYAWTFLGWTYWVDGVYHSAHYDREQSFESALKMAQKAISIDIKSSDAHVLFSLIYITQKKYDDAEAFGKKAIDLDPNSSENHGLVAITMQNSGKFEEAIALLKQAMRLDPYYPNWYLMRLGMCYRMVGMYEESVAALKEGLQRFRKGGAAPWDRGYLYLAATYSMMGRMDEARDYVSKALEFNPKMSADAWRKRLQYKDPQHTERILDALRKAGLPETPPLPLPDKPSIAVLPFVNMSDDPKQEYFSDGITEEIITALSKTPKLFVIARNSTFTYKGKPTKVQQVGRELGVKYVLEGSVRKAGNRARITAQLVDAQTGNHLWAERYDRELKDIFAIQDEITKKIITALQIELREGEQAHIYARGTDNLEAYLKFLEAIEYGRRQNPDDNQKAKRIVKQSIALDPNYAVAYRLLGATHMMDVWLGLTKSPKDSLRRAVELSKKAIALDESLGMAHGLLGHIYILMKDYEKGIEVGQRAVEVAPNDADAHAYLGMGLRFADRPEEAIKAFKRAMRLNPKAPSWYLHSLAEANRNMGRYDEAIKWGKKAVDRNPKNLPAHLTLAASYSLAGREKEAQAEAAEIMRISPNYSLERLAKTDPSKNQVKKKRYIDALRKAGLK
jgi:adenylate cyclase